MTVILGETVGAGEDLERPGYVEKLDIREAEDLNPAGVWRDLWGVWHFRQILACDKTAVEQQETEG